MRYRSVLTTVVIGVLVCSGCGGGGGGGYTPPETPSSRVKGYVKNAVDRSGLVEATVTVGGKDATTDANGYYEIFGVSIGSQSVIVTPPNGYLLAGPVPARRVTSGTTTIPDIYLAPSNLSPPAVPAL